LISSINATPKLSDEVVEKLHAAAKDFKANGSF